MPEVIIKPSFDREEFVAFATFNLPAGMPFEQVQFRAIRIANKWFDDMRKKYDWEPSKHGGEDEFYLIDKGFAPMEWGPEMTVDNNRGLVSGPYIPDLNNKKWRIAARFHGLPIRIEHTVDDPSSLPETFYTPDELPDELVLGH